MPARYDDRAAAAVPLADTIEEYWAEAGIEVDTVQEGGWSVQRPDFWVTQLHLLGLHRNAKKLQIIRRWFWLRACRRCATGRRRSDASSRA